MRHPIPTHTRTAGAWSLFIWAITSLILAIMLPYLWWFSHLEAVFKILFFSIWILSIISLWKTEKKIKRLPNLTTIFFKTNFLDFLESESID